MAACPRASRRASAPRRLTLRSHPRLVALVGNANVGKSAIFGRLTGLYATVSNYPGTTVTLTSGHAAVGGEVYEVVDTPGVATLEGVLSEDEAVARQVLVERDVDVIVQVADARNLRRALMLTWQIARLGRPTVLVLNMVDESRRRGVFIDTASLSADLGIPVVETVAIEGRGMAELGRAIEQAAVPEVPAGTSEDGQAWADSAAGRYRRFEPGRLARFEEWLERAVRQPLTGLPILAAVLCVFYLFVGVFGAQTLVEVIEGNLFGAIVNPAATALADRFVPLPIVRDFLVGEYGLVTMGLTYAIAIVLPIVATFFLLFGWLEDSGYVPRLAIFSDRVFRSMGLNGKAVLPMVLGLGCDTMATMTTRILGTRKERLIAVLLLALGVPCSAQLATILGILGGISASALATLMVVVLTEMFVAGYLAAKVLPGERSDFILELPPLRWPSWPNLLRKTLARIRWYLGEAVPLFLVGTVLLFVLDRVGGLALLTRTAQPVVGGLLGLPEETAQVFVMGFLRRDYGAAGLFQMSQAGMLSHLQAVVALTVMTLFVPCVAHFLVMMREQGLRAAFSIFVVVTLLAIATGTGLNHALRFFGIDF